MRPGIKLAPNALPALLDHNVSLVPGVVVLVSAICTENVVMVYPETGPVPVMSMYEQEVLEPSQGTHARPVLVVTSTVINANHVPTCKWYNVLMET